jgi:acyl-CoA synthetase (NDP forming)
VQAVLKKAMKEMLASSRERGWVMEPEAKRLFSLAGLSVPRFAVAGDLATAVLAAGKIGYPVVAKVVSPDVVHKSDVGGVVPGISTESELKKAFQRISTIKGFTEVLIEEMLSGVELIVGAKVDRQFGPVVILGIGGTGVELYDDVSIRMAPLSPSDVDSMIGGLKARALLEGYRGAPPVNRRALTEMLVAFSRLVMELEGTIDSIDLNPVFCSKERCVVGDARIMLRR